MLHAIKQAKEAGCFERICVTSDDEEVLSIAMSQRVDVHKRPAELAAPTVTVAHVCMFLLQMDEYRGYDAICVLLATSPLRTADDIRACVKLMEDNYHWANGVMSVAAFSHPPEHALYLNEAGCVLTKSVLIQAQSQQMKPSYRHDGSVIVIKPGALVDVRDFYCDKLLGYVVPHATVDVNTEEDLRWAQFLAGKKKSALAVVSHPDDEVFCGGTLARLVNEGWEVAVCFMGDGRPVSRDDSRKALNALGISPVAIYRWSLPDNRFDSVDLLDIVALIETAITVEQPDVVFTHSSADCNIDHRRVHEAVLAATRPYGGCPVKEVLAFEVLSSTEWGIRQFAPTLFVDISATLEKKIAAFNCYETEKREFPHPRSEKAIRAAATRWGSVAGCEAAEAFEVVRQRR